jgi:hypothetical protein
MNILKIKFLLLFLIININLYGQNFIFSKIQNSVLYKNSKSSILLKDKVFFNSNYSNNNYNSIDIKDVNKEILDINLRMDKHWSLYKTGLNFIMFGSGVVILGGSIYSSIFLDRNTNPSILNDRIESNKRIGGLIIATGLSLSTVGYIYTIHSHSVFNRKNRFKYLDNKK